jgi:hypothetical protein
LETDYREATEKLEEQTSALNSLQQEKEQLESELKQCR